MPPASGRSSRRVEAARTTSAAADGLLSAEAAPVGRADASAVWSTPAVAIYAIALGYGGRLWLEVSHPASGIAHTPAAVISWWLKGASVMLPATLAITWAIAALARRRARAGSLGWLPGAAAWLVLGPLAIAAVTALLLPVQIWLTPELHAHGELPPPSYEFGSFLQLLRADVLLAMAILLLRGIGRAVAHPVAVAPPIVSDESNENARSC